ncbi:MAG TPA: respiratory nitrate reductase subunit gamma [Bacillota bacterium]|nr:respiratory nitrate reductase subunit gamma [Bacillota bacterium]
MSLVDQFLWLIYPYIMLTLFVFGHIYRYNTDLFGWSAKSSEFLEKSQLRMASLLFHWGILFVFLGHVAGVLIPKYIYLWLGIPDELYHFGAIWGGGAAGVITIIGVFLLFGRRVSVKRILVNSGKSDFIVLTLLIIVILTGFTNTVGYTATGGEFDYREYIGPWFRGLLTFSPLPQLVATAPLGFRIHILCAFLLFGIWPFTRLVHVWSAPLTYLNRRYVVYRSMKPRKL